MRVSEKFKKLVNQGDKAFKLKHQQTLGQITLPSGAPKHAGEIAAATPWTGTEQVGDQVNRMLQDSHKKLRSDRKVRLSIARENAIDYQFNPGKTYKDRAQPPRNTSSGISTGGSIESIANQHIEDAIARGQFDDLPRGKPIDRRIYKLENPYIDTTELILNRMIKRQGAAPPWILKQSSMHQQVKVFREKTTNQIVTMMVHHYDDFPNSETLSYDSPRSIEWKGQQRAFHEAAIDKLNSVIRGYNLQAPQSARKGYLNVDSEIKQCFVTAAERVPEALEIFKGNKKVTQTKVLHRALRGQEDSSNHYGLLDMLGWRTKSR